MKSLTRMDCPTCGGTGEVPYGNDGYGVIEFSCERCDDGKLTVEVGSVEHKLLLLESTPQPDLMNFAE